jgi:hypothetical protein
MEATMAESKRVEGLIDLDEISDAELLKLLGFVPVSLKTRRAKFLQGKQKTELTVIPKAGKASWTFCFESGTKVPYLVTKREGLTLAVDRNHNYWIGDGINDVQKAVLIEIGFRSFADSAF